MAKDDFSGGFDELTKDLEKYMAMSDKAPEALIEGAKALVEDLMKLPKPISKINKPGYTHLINSFTFRRSDKEVEVGWGKYYGPMLERGTVRALSQPMIRPVWDRNKEKYQSIMIKTLGF